MTKKSDRAGNSRLLSLPDELLQIILGLADHPSDRCSVALSCSRLRRLSRRTPHALRLDYFSCRRFLNSRRARSRLSYTRQPPLPPVHLLPSLQSLTLLYVPSDLLPITRCSSLTSLTLCAPDSSDLSSLAFSSSSLVSSSSSRSSRASFSSLSSATPPSPLASSPPSPLRTTLTSLTIHSADLQGSLPSLAFFPSLTSLSLHSCTIDPYELRSLSRSLHSLTHLTIHSSPLISSDSLAPILQANPSLSSLSLHGTTYRLFRAQGFRSLLSRCSSQLRSLHLAGLPCFRPGLLADCRGLSSLSVEGVIESKESLLPNNVSLDCLVAMLVRVEQTGVAGGRPGGEAGGESGAEGWENGHAGVSAAAAAATGSGSSKRCRKYVDFCTEAAAAQADKIAAATDVVDLFKAADEAAKAARYDAHWAAFIVGENAVPRIAASLGKIRSGISACRSFSAGIRASNAAVEWEEKLMRAFNTNAAADSNTDAAAAAADLNIDGAAADSNIETAADHVAGFFATELNGGEEDGDGEAEEGDDIRGMDGMLPDDGLPEGVLGGVWSSAVETREEGLGRQRELLEELEEQFAAMSASFQSLRQLNRAPRATLAPPVADAAAAGAAAGDAAAGAAAGDAAAGTVEAAPGEAAALGEAAAPGEAAPGEAAAVEAAPGEASPGEAAPPGDGKQSGSRRSTSKRSEGCQSAVPVQVFCPRLESLSLEVLYFSTTPHTWLPPTLPSAPPLMYLSSPPPSSFHTSSSSNSSCLSPSSDSAARSPSIQAMSFHSIARAAVFGQLKRLSLVCYLGLEEQEWLKLLTARVKLEELKVQQNDKFSDAVMAGSRLSMLTSLTVLGCPKITAAGIGEVLGSFPRLRYLKVEVGKVQVRARRELLRAGVVVSFASARSGGPSVGYGFYLLDPTTEDQATTSSPSSHPDFEHKTRRRIILLIAVLPRRCTFALTSGQGRTASASRKPRTARSANCSFWRLPDSLFRGQLVMAEHREGADDSRLLSLPDELLKIILGLADHPSDRSNVALSCSRLRHLSRRTPHALRLEFHSRSRAANPQEWLKKFEDFSGVFTHVTDLTVEITSVLGDQVIAGIAAGCPKLEQLKLEVSAWDIFDVNGPAWRNLANRCPLLASLELNSPSARSRSPHTQQPPLPPVHLLPSLQSLSLLYVPSDYLSIPRCSSLTSLTLWGPESSSLSSLAFSPSSCASSSSVASSRPSSLRTSLTSLTIYSAQLSCSFAPLTFFPSLSSLSLHSCSIDRYELRSLSRSLYKRTHIAIHSCPFVSSYSLIPTLQANPALSSLSLHGTNYCLFAAQGFRSLLARCSSQLHSLHLAGFPSLRPGLLADCSALRSLSVVGAVD
ncbi:unnamed protein product, partial [Closterium sp. Naga37s-1]